VGEIEVPLAHGDVTEGVVRVGDTVRRPTGPHSELVHAVLGHLSAAGVAAPLFLGHDDRSREILSFVEGEVAGRPWPAWVADESRSVSVAHLLRRLDDALVPFGIPQEVRARPRPPGAPEPVGPAATFLGHRDVTPENTVFRDGSAYSFIDFDLIRPSSRVDEVTNLLLWWAGWTHPDDRDPALADVDPARRARVLVDAYGLDDADRTWVVPVAISGAQQSWFSMRDRARNHGGGWLRMWNDGVGDQIRRREAWLTDNQDELRQAVTR
jgi:hypothetical protein